MGSRENIKEILKTLIENKGVSQKDFAEAIGVQDAAVSKWLSGIQIPKVELYDAICEYFNVTLDQLFGRAPLN